MAHKVINFDGEDHLVITEKATDGGMVVNYFSPTPDGKGANFRHWFSDPELAQAEFDATDEKKMRELRAAAFDMLGLATG